jgi:hypothetical protein
LIKTAGPKRLGVDVGALIYSGPLFKFTKADLIVGRNFLAKLNDANAL